MQRPVALPHEKKHTLAGAVQAGSYFPRLRRRYGAGPPIMVLFTRSDSVLPISWRSLCDVRAALGVSRTPRKFPVNRDINHAVDVARASCDQAFRSGACGSCCSASHVFSACSKRCSRCRACARRPSGWLLVDGLQRHGVWHGGPRRRDQAHEIRLVHG